jgi:thioester reductase-like protein
MALRIETIIQGEVETGSTQGDQRVAEDARLADMLVPPAGQQVPLWPAGRATVFHSGEGGMLSHWILRHILQDPDIDVIYLGSGRTVEESQRIIADDWTRLGFGRLDLLEKIDILPGSLAQQRFGLSQEAWDDLAETADVLFHAGIHINMAARYAQLRPANVLGTREMMRLSLHKKLKPLHAIGSYAVIDHSTVSQHGDAFFEDSPFPSYAGLEGDYRKTRWASESMMQAAIARGMPIALHRIPLMCGDSRTGLTDPGEIAWRLCKAMIVTGGVPESKRPLDIAPIDHAVDALFTLVKDGSAAPGINHIIGARSLVWADMADALRHMGYQVADMAPAEWYARLSQWIETNPEDDSLGGLMPLVNADAADHSKFYHVDGGATRDRLAALGFTLSPTQRDDLVRTLDYLVQADILPALEKCKVGAA